MAPPPWPALHNGEGRAEHVQTTLLLRALGRWLGKEIMWACPTRSRALVFHPTQKPRSSQQPQFFYFYLFFLVVLGKEPRASHKLGKCSVTELHPRPPSVRLYSFKAFEGLTV